MHLEQLFDNDFKEDFFMSGLSLFFTMVGVVVFVRQLFVIEDYIESLPF